MSNGGTLTSVLLQSVILQTLILPGHALALRKPLFQKQEAPQPREAACSIPLCHY